MLENQFIRFYERNVVRSSSMMLLGAYKFDENDYVVEGISIFIPTKTIQIAFINDALDDLEPLSVLDVSFDQSKTYKRFRFYNMSLDHFGAKPGDIVHIRLKSPHPYIVDQYDYVYSNPLVVVDSAQLSRIDYGCNEDAFGFPFATGDTIGGNTLTYHLPIRLHSPQNVQDDKTYVKTNGEVVTLYAKYYKEWEGETEYLSEEMHDKIVAALSCDEVYINGKRVTKSDKYQVDWENYDLDCDGVTKLAKATFKVREHITQRNSNY